jgi:hypothetical protein
MSSRRPRTFPAGLVAVGALGVVVLGGFLALRARSPEPTADPSTAAAPSGVAALEALLESPAGSAAPGESDPSKVHILSKTSLTEAIQAARPSMSNTIGRLDAGSAMLALWASKNLSWRALEALPETSPALFKKDPDAERGSRLCISGTVLEIRAEKTLSNRIVEDRAHPLIERTAPSQTQQPSDTRPEGTASAGATASVDSLLPQGTDFAIPDGGKVYIATMQSKLEAPPEGVRTKSRDSLFVEIIAVKSSGTLVDGSEARACGILTGVTVPPAGGTTAVAVDSSPVHRIVGMFDLPQNRATAGVEVTAQHN